MNFSIDKNSGAKWFFKSSYRLFFFLLLIVVFIEVFLFFGLRSSLDAINTQNVMEQNTNASLLVSQMVEGHFKGLEYYVESYARRRNSLQSQKDINLIAIDIEEMVAYSKFIDRVMVTDFFGNVMSVYPKEKSLIGKNFAYRDWYKNIQVKKATLLTDAYRTVVPPYRQVISVVSPYKNTQGKIVGYVVSQTRIASLATWIVNQKMARKGNILLIDQSGNIIGKNDSNKKEILT